MGGAGGVESSASSSRPGSVSLVPTAPGAARTAAEHLQREHQPLSLCSGVWAGQHELLLVGAERVAAAAVHVHLLGVDVETTKKPQPGAWVRAVGLGSAPPAPPRPAPECDPCSSRTAPGRRRCQVPGPRGALRSVPPALAGLPSSRAVRRGSAFAPGRLMEAGRRPGHLTGWHALRWGRLPAWGQQLTWRRRGRSPHSGSPSRWPCTPCT